MGAGIVVRWLKPPPATLASYMMPICVLIAPLPNQLPDSGLGKQQKMADKTVALSKTGCCGHLGIKLVDGRSLSLCVFSSFATTIFKINKYFLFKKFALGPVQ